MHCARNVISERRLPTATKSASKVSVILAAALLAPAAANGQTRVTFVPSVAVSAISDSNVFSTAQRSADPTHARAGVEDPCPARDQCVGQASLALDVRAVRDQLGEVATVAAADVGRPLPARRGQVSAHAGDPTTLSVPPRRLVG